MDMYVGEPSTTSSCISLTTPEILAYGTELVISGSAALGTKNALAIHVSNGVGLVYVFDCYPLVNISADMGLSLGTHNLTAVDWTDDPSCLLLLEQTISVQKPIIEFNTSVLPAIVVSNETQLELVLWIVGGTDVQLNVDWADGTMCSIACANIADMTVVTLNHTYANPGNYTVTGRVANLIRNVSLESQLVVVYERIQDLVLYGNSTALAPAHGVWIVAAGIDQLPLDDVWCVWNMGTNYGDSSQYVERLSQSTYNQISFGYAEADAGTQSVWVNCFNPVSSQNLTMDVSVIWDNVTLGGLTCNSSTLWNYSMTCQLGIVRFGSGACFEWDMGDGDPNVCFQDGYCATGVTAASPTYVQVSSVATSRPLLIVTGAPPWPNHRRQLRTFLWTCRKLESGPSFMMRNGYKT